MVDPMPPPIAPSVLYSHADAFYQLAPWEWMDETNLLALRLPGLEEPAFVSVMGMAGNHTALALYLGLEALERFNLMHAGEDISQGDQIRLVLESRQLQASFNERAGLEKSELAEIKSLGRKYRGENWPCFRSFQPGKAPGPVTPQEAVWLGIALEQIQPVALRLRGAEFKSFRNKAGVMEIMCREPVEGTGRWQSRWIPFHTRDFEFPRPECNPFLAAAVAKQARAVDLECVFHLVPRGIGPRFGERTYPYLLLMADADSGLVLGLEMLSVEEQTFEEMIAGVPNLFLKLCDKARIRPRTLACSGVSTAELLKAPARALGIKAVAYDSLPELERMLASMPF